MLCVFWLLHQPAIPTSLCFPLGFPVPWDTTILELGRLIILQWSLCSCERKSHISLTLNKLGMIKLRLEESMSKAELGWKIGLLHQKVSQVVNAKKNFLKEIKRLRVLLQWTHER